MLNKQKIVIARLKKELERLRARYPLQEKICCQLCGKKFNALNFSHLSRIHDVSSEDYKQEFKSDYVQSDMSRLKRARKNVFTKAEKIWLRKFWGREIFDYQLVSKIMDLPVGTLKRYRKYFGLKRMRQPWNKTLIRHAIERRIKNKQSIQYLIARAENLPLVMAAERHFGNWTKAVKSLGIDYAMCFPHRWSGKKVIQKLRERYHRHLSLHYTALHKTRDGRCLYDEAAYYFGNFRNAIKAAKINPEKVIGPPRQYWSPEKILAALKKRARQGQSLLRSVVKQEDSRLFSATCKYFREWDIALEFGGRHT